MKQCYVFWQFEAKIIINMRFCIVVGWLFKDAVHNWDDRRLSSRVSVLLTALVTSKWFLSPFVFLNYYISLRFIPKIMRSKSLFVSTFLSVCSMLCAWQSIILSVKIFVSDILWEMRISKNRPVKAITIMIAPILKLQHIDVVVVIFSGPICRRRRKKGSMLTTAYRPTYM